MHPDPYCLSLRLRLSVIPICLLLACTVLSKSPAQAEIGAAIMRPPQYWSSTNCGFAGIILTDTPGTYLESAAVYINGEITKSYARDPNKPNPPADWDGGLAFDSTHFPDMTMVTVKITAVNNIGETDQDRYQVSARAYNKGVSYGNRTLSFGVATMTEVGYREASMLGTFWISSIARKTEILDIMPRDTVFFIDTHGDAGVFGDCYALPGSGPEHYILNSEVAPAIANKTASQPAYAFVQISACYSGADSRLAEAFGITTAAVNRAFLGWWSGCYDSQVKLDWIKEFWRRLELTDSVIDSVLMAGAVVPPETDPVIYGDEFTKVHGVYHGLPGQWYRW